jgi:hypothetical protein
VFTYTIEVQPKGPMRLLGPIVRSGLRKDLQKLEALLESDQWRDATAEADHPSV